MAENCAAGRRPAPPPRSTYRHGDLRRALLDAGIELARAGGPDAVVLREATRRAGVVPNAAYRHFASRQELLQAVRAAALSALAVAMEAELARLRRRRPEAESPRASLRAVGTGYLRFALAETGLFRTAFGRPLPARGRPRRPTRPAPAGSIPSSCSAWRSTGWSRRACCRPSGARARIPRLVGRAWPRDAADRRAAAPASARRSGRSRSA